MLEVLCCVLVLVLVCPLTSQYFEAPHMVASRGIDLWLNRHTPGRPTAERCAGTGQRPGRRRQRQELLGPRAQALCDLLVDGAEARGDKIVPAEPGAGIGRIYTVDTHPEQSPGQAEEAVAIVA